MKILLNGMHENSDPSRPSPGEEGLLRLSRLSPSPGVAPCMLDALSARVGVGLPPFGVVGLLLAPFGVVGLLLAPIRAIGLLISPFGVVSLLISPFGVVGLLGGLLPDLVLPDLALREPRERLPAPPDPYTLPMILVAWADI